MDARLDQEIRLSIRIGINGFGRMGCLGLRADREHANLQFTHIKASLVQWVL